MCWFLLHNGERPHLQRAVVPERWRNCGKWEFPFISLLGIRLCRWFWREVSRWPAGSDLHPSFCCRNAALFLSFWFLFCRTTIFNMKTASILIEFIKTVVLCWRLHLSWKTFMVLSCQWVRTDRKRWNGSMKVSDNHRVFSPLWSFVLQTKLEDGIKTVSQKGKCGTMLTVTVRAPAELNLHLFLFQKWK